jgi:hypothetical protein
VSVYELSEDEATLTHTFSGGSELDNGFGCDEEWTLVYEK